MWPYLIDKKKENKLFKISKKKPMKMDIEEKNITQFIDIM